MKTEHPLSQLKSFIPEGSFDLLLQYIQNYHVHLTISRARKTVLGDYRHASHQKNHRISVNGNLNKFEFLITLLHEIAHLLTYTQFGNAVESHGREWKRNYSALLVDFIRLKIFPQEIELALQRTLINPSATANGETALLKTLRKYDEDKHPDTCMIHQLGIGSSFQTKDGRVFRILEKKRTRYRCEEVKTKNIYSFSEIYEVLPVKK